MPNTPDTPAATAALVDDRRAGHGEGPVWNPASEELLWVDLTGCRLHFHHPESGATRTLEFDEPVCAAAPDADGSLTIAFAKRIRRVDPLNGNASPVCEVEPDLPGNRCNDGKRDPAGRFWIGTMSEDGTVEGAGSLYRLDGNSPTRIIDNLTIANGMGWSGDHRTMFFIDSPTCEVWAYDFNPADSSISNRRTVVRVPESLGVPDGMEVAPDDSLWVAHWGSGCVCHWDPRTGTLLEMVATGCPHTTSCALAGKQRDILYITTSRLGLDDNSLSLAPHSGGLFKHRV